ncbi:uncharacterized protein LOC127122942 [Lathyrus oleraceus]|uniref:uncharacterized protein LOC127122942 n=1 Tax=Pisum sativum TaxID=3888 RepID=UPI0021CE7AC6|nr:uncharacterized protein LOC127122942 [Pisum sativum]
MRIEELHISLEAQELHLTERTSEREVEQILKASFVKQEQKQSWSEAKKRYVLPLRCRMLVKEERKPEEANIARSTDDEHVLLMASDSDSTSLEDWRYMDTSCSNHLTGNKKWLVDFNFGKRTKIRCANDKHLNAEGMRNVRVTLNNGKSD